MGRRSSQRHTLLLSWKINGNHLNATLLQSKFRFNGTLNDLNQVKSSALNIRHPIPDPSVTEALSIEIDFHIVDSGAAASSPREEPHPRFQVDALDQDPVCVE